MFDIVNYKGQRFELVGETTLRIKDETFPAEEWKSRCAQCGDPYTFAVLKRWHVGPTRRCLVCRTFEPHRRFKADEIHPAARA